MEMLKAMKECLPGGHVARRAYPNRKYHKNENGIFPDSGNVDYIDFISTDWEYYSPKTNEDGFPHGNSGLSRQVFPIR